MELSAGSTRTCFLRCQSTCDSYGYLYIVHFCFVKKHRVNEYCNAMHTLMITPSEPFFLTCLLMLFIIPAGIISPNMLKHTDLWQKHLFISLWAVPSVAFAGWQHLKGVWYQRSCEGRLWESRPVTISPAQGAGSGLLRKGELWKCCVGCNFANASEVWGNGCKTIFSLLLNPSGETLESQYYITSF